jgi:outer membrane receptor protein involved in Fe transport
LIKNSTRNRLLATTIICGTAFAALPVMAQEAAGPVEEIVVTGSRIARKDFIANSPVSTVTAEVIKATGNTNVEDILNTLPQVVPGFTAASNNPSDGTATVDLRGLGASRTLVLVNGRRMNPSGRDATVDLNNIPTGLIEKVEVVTGGASAVYGSDALAGVVNFQLKQNFQGLEFSGQYGKSGLSDGERSDMSLIFGSNVADGKGNVTGFVSYSDRNQILPNADRAWSLVNAAGGSGTGLNGGLNKIALNPWTGGRFAFNQDGSVRPFVNDFSLAPTSDRYNFAPVNPLLSPSERFNMAFLAHYDVTSDIQAYAEVFYTDSRNNSQLAPTPATNIQIPYNNAFVSPSLAALLDSRPDATANMDYSRRMAEVGARIQNNNSDVYQINTGLKANLPNDWKAEGYYTYGRTEFVNQIQNDVSRSRLSAALSAGPGASKTSCSAAALAIYPTCVPINVFGAGNISKQAADFIRLNFTDQAVFERQLVSANASGPIFKLPAGDLAVAVGAEYRRDSLSYTPDAAKASGDIYGFNAEKPVGGAFTVGELYGEALVPLIAAQPFVEYLGLELGARYSDYSSVGGVTSYKAGLEYKPVSDLRVRAMFQRSSRAPSVFELYQAGDQGFPAVVDPCSTKNLTTGADVTLSTAVRAFCTTQLGVDPVTAGFVAQNTQLESFSFGNPGLKEEKSDTVTFGAVWTPSYVPSLSVTVDYYTIKVEDYIDTLEGGASGIVKGCFASLNLSSAACNDTGIGLPLIFRDPAGSLKVRTPSANVSELETKGVDLSAAYMLELPFADGIWGKSLSLGLQLTYLDSYVLDDVEYKGTVGAYNISAALPEYKANLRVGYDIGPVRIAYTGNYIGKMENQGNIPAFDDGGYSNVDAYWYHDVNARWGVNDNVELFGGIKNIGDKEPPVFDNAPDGNTDPNTYDVIGRYFYGGVTLRF